MLGAGGSPRQQRAESPSFLRSPTQVPARGEGSLRGRGRRKACGHPRAFDSRSGERWDVALDPSPGPLFCREVSANLIHSTQFRRLSGRQRRRRANAEPGARRF